MSDTHQPGFHADRGTIHSLASFSVHSQILSHSHGEKLTCLLPSALLLALNTFVAHRWWQLQLQCQSWAQLCVEFARWLPLTRVMLWWVKSSGGLWQGWQTALLHFWSALRSADTSILIPAHYSISCCLMVSPCVLCCLMLPHGVSLCLMLPHGVLLCLVVFLVLTKNTTRCEAWSRHGKAKETSILHYWRSISDDTRYFTYQRATPSDDPLFVILQLWISTLQLFLHRNLVKSHQTNIASHAVKPLKPYWTH